MTNPQILINEIIVIKPVEIAVGIDIHNHSEIVKKRGNWMQRNLAKVSNWPLLGFISDRIKKGVNDQVEKQISARLKKDIEEKVNSELVAKLREKVPMQIKEQLKAEGIDADVTVSVD
jgi:hypothetical protein